MYPELRDRGRYALLLVDGHKSRMNPDMLEFAARHNILVLCYPPNATSKLQGLDVAVHGPLKNVAAANVSSLHASGIPLSQDNLIQLVIYPAWKTAFTASNIKRGFAATGVYPPNRRAVSDAELMPSTLTDAKQAPSLSSFVAQSAAADFAQKPAKPMDPYFEGLLDKPLYKGDDRKGKEKPIARLLTNQILIDRMRAKRDKEDAKKVQQEAKKRRAEERKQRKEAKERKKAEKRAEREAAAEARRAAKAAAAGKAKPKAKAKAKPKANAKAKPKGKGKRKRPVSSSDSSSDSSDSDSSLSEAQDRASYSSSSNSAEGSRAKSRRTGEASARSSAGSKTSTSAAAVDHSDLCKSCKHPPSDEGVRCNGCAQVYCLKCAPGRARPGWSKDDFFCTKCRNRLVAD
jgi:hypothetical protein